MTSQALTKGVKTALACGVAVLPLSLGALAPAQAADSKVAITGLTSEDDSVTISNQSAESLDLSGYQLSDNKKGKDSYTFPSNTVLAAGQSLTVEQDDSGQTGFEFGIDEKETVYLFDAQGKQVDSFDAEDSADSQGSSGSSASSGTSTWPGASTVTAIDEEDSSRSEWSGLDYADGSLWAVENGGGTLYKLSVSGASAQEEQSWTLRYPDGSGTVDAEGVTLADDGYVYVSSERNSDDSETSRPSILRYDTSSSGELKATAEWNLSDDFPDLDPNKGLEGITWIPDSWLTAQGLVDESTGEIYQPSDYANHGSGLFAVAVEGESAVYLYALSEDGTASQVASIQTDFSLVAELEFSADAGGLWLASDETDDGQMATYSIGSDGAFVQTARYARPEDSENYANEGFTFADPAQSSDGTIATYYADDLNTDGHSLRQGSLTLAELASTTVSSQDGGSGSSASASATATEETAGASGASLQLALGIGVAALVLIGVVVYSVLRNREKG